MSQHATHRGRYAPSPTGELHLGNASTALLAWLSIRSRGGGFVLRMEDLDRPRVRPGAAENLLRDLAWLGLDWDEGPDVGGPHAPYEQSRRHALYDAAFRKLDEAGRVYPCFCSRKDIAAAASAPQAPGDEVRYPGTCRGLDAGDAQRRVAAGLAHAWRFRVGEEEAPTFVDLVRGPYAEPLPPGDFVVRRSDGSTAYQLAVVVDDAAMEMTEVVRGDDLTSSTLRQLLLYRALGLRVPAFAHVPLLLGPDGVRLSKRHEGTSIEELRARGAAAERILGGLAALLGLASDAAPRSTRSLLEGFQLTRVAGLSGGIAISSYPNFFNRS